MRINLKSISIISGLALAAVGCGGDDDKKDAGGDMTAVSPDLSIFDAGGEPTYNPNGALTLVTGQAISPESAWIGGYPFIAGETVTWYYLLNAPTATSGAADPTAGTMGAWTLNADQGTVVRPLVPGDSTYLPSVSDNLEIGTQAPTGIPAHMWTKSGPCSVATLVGGAGGPDEATLLAQGAALFEALTSHDPQPVIDPATITVAETGFDIYAIHGSDSDTTVPAGTCTVTKSNDGGVSGRFLVTKNGNTENTSVTIQATDKNNVLHYNPHVVSVFPGYFVFAPVVHDS